MHTPTEPNADDARRRWLALLAQAPRAELARQAPPIIADHRFDTLRVPPSFEAFAEWARTHVEGAHAPGADRHDLAFLRQQHQVQQAHVRLMAGFEPGLVRAPLHVFTARASTRGCEADPAGWLAHTENPGRSNARVLAGSHESLLQRADNTLAIAGALSGAA